MLLLSPCFVASAQKSEPHLMLFLLIGQSNMAGRGELAKDPTPADPNIFMLSKDCEWVPARHPIHFDKPVAGVGLALEFAHQIKKEFPSSRVGLIPCAIGGSSLDEWQPGTVNYAEAVRRTREALKNGRLAGILWHQGESDVEAHKRTTYFKRFSSMIMQLRKDLKAPLVPLVIGELGDFRKEHVEFNRQIPSIAGSVPLCLFAHSDGLKDKGDTLHFDAPSLEKLGQRYAEAYLKLIRHP